jgi:hypothetical protein
MTVLVDRRNHCLTHGHLSITEKPEPCPECLAEPAPQCERGKNTARRCRRTDVKLVWGFLETTRGEHYRSETMGYYCPKCDPGTGEPPA